VLGDDFKKKQEILPVIGVLNFDVKVCKLWDLVQIRGRLSGLGL
jgi:hypothetical protein